MFQYKLHQYIIMHFHQERQLCIVMSLPCSENVNAFPLIYPLINQFNTTSQFFMTKTYILLSSRQWFLLCSSFAYIKAVETNLLTVPQVFQHWQTNDKLQISLKPTCDYSPLLWNLQLYIGVVSLKTWYKCTL